MGYEAFYQSSKWPGSMGGLVSGSDMAESRDPNLTWWK